MALLLADKRISLFVLDGKPADPGNPVVADFEDAVNASCKVFFDGTFLRASGSDTINYKLLCGDNKAAWGASNFEGALNVARFLDPATGLPDEDDDLWPVVKEKDTELWLAWRVGPAWDASAGDGQEVSVFKVTTDVPQEPQSYDDYVKALVPLAVADAWPFVEVSAGD